MVTTVVQEKVQALVVDHKQATLLAALKSLTQTFSGPCWHAPCGKRTHTD